jgi:beta-lactamase regulating signal transducer with metallopeptidase domain/Leucine-rich repeat (LRR) protein
MTVTLVDLSAIASAQFWQVTAVCVLVAVLTRLACRHRPHLAYLLWMLVVIKAVTPPLVASPTGLFSWLKRDVTPPVVAVVIKPPVAASTENSFVRPRLPRASTAPKRSSARIVTPERAVAPVAEYKFPLSLAETLWGVWIAGCGGLLAIVAAKWWRIRRRWLAEACEEGAALEEALLKQLAVELGVRRRVRLVVSWAVDTPAVFGVMRPTILLPVALVRQMSAEALRPILAHELIHVRRGDPAAALLQLAAQVLWWFHPLIWWANREARRERERACDEETVSALGCRAADYARTLLAVLESRAVRQPIFPLPSVGMFGVTVQRLQHIIRRADRFHRRTPSAYYGLALVALALLLPGAGLKVAAQPTKGKQRLATAAEPAPESAGKTAIARLRKLGAAVSVALGEKGSQKVSVSFGTNWKGAQTDFGLIGDVEPDAKVDVSIDLATVAPRGLSELKLRQPLVDLRLNNATDKALTELRGLPLCDELTIGSGQLAVATWRHVAALATDVESLYLYDYSHELWDGTFDAGLAELGGLEKLKSLAIDRFPMTDVGLKQLAGMKSLSHLTLDECPGLEDSDFGALADLGSLRSLKLWLRVSAAAVANIAQLRELEELGLIVFDLDPAEVEPLARLTHLETLSIRSNHSRSAESTPEAEAQWQKVRLRKIPLGDAIARVAGRMPSLRNLDLQAPESEQGLTALVANQKLQAIAIDLAAVDDMSLAVVCRLNDLRQLTLRGPAKLTDAGLAPLEGLTRLVKLELPPQGLTDAGLAHLAPLTTIEELNLSGGKITGSGLAALKRWKALKSLTLSESSFNDEGCRFLPQFVSLQTLGLDSTQITDGGLEAIGKLSNLRRLEIQNDTGVTDVGLAHLGQLKDLEWLYAMGTGISPQGVAALQNVIPGVDIHSQSSYVFTTLSYVTNNEFVDADSVDAAGTVEAAPATQPTEVEKNARQALLKQLADRGAQVYEGGGSLGAVSFEPRGARCQIQFPDSWKGTADDWKLLGTIDHPEKLTLFLSADQLPGLAQVHFDRPIAGITLRIHSGKQLAQIERLPQSRSLWVEDENLTLADYRRLFELVPDVETLTLTGAPTDGDSLGFSDGAAAEMDARMKHLVSLSLNEPLSAAGLQTIGKLDTLKQLSIKTLAIAPADVAPLARLTKLQALHIGPGLVEVNLPDRREEIPVGDAIATAVAAIPSLRILDIETRLSDRGLESLAPAEGLQALTAELNSVDDRAIAAVSQLTSLGVLHLSGEGHITDAGLAPLENLTKLVDLELPGRGLTDAALAHLAPLTALRELELSGSHITGSSLESLQGMKQFESLLLAGSAFDDAGCRRLPELLPRLAKLDLSRTEVTDAAMTAIGKLSDLTDLKLSKTKITDAGLTQLEPLKKLRMLEISGSRATEKGVVALKAAIPTVQVTNNTGSAGGVSFGAVWTSGSLDVAPDPNDVSSPDDSTEKDGPAPENQGADHAAAAGEKALMQLRGSGAQAREMPSEPGKRSFAVTFGASWRGQDADLALLDDLAKLGGVTVGLDFSRVTPETLSNLKLAEPLEALELDASDSRFAKLTGLPPCRCLLISPCPLSSAVCQKLLAIAGGIESLTLYGQRLEQPPPGLSDENLVELSGLTNLKSLLILSAEITDVGIAALSRMKRLETLSLMECPALEISGLKALAELQSLRSLDLDWAVTAGGLASIGRLGSLEKLEFETADLKPADFEPLTGLTHLQDLSVEWKRNSYGHEIRPRQDRHSEVSLGDGIARVAGKMPSLRTLSMAVTIDNEGLESLTAADQLESLILEMAEVDARSLELASRLPALQKFVVLGEEKLSDEALGHLEKATRLVRLRLPATGITDAGLVHLTGLTAIENLELPGSSITNSGLATLAGLKKLKTLNLADAPIDDGSCQLVAKLFPRLRELDLRRTKITDAGVESIASLTDLDYLILDHTAITDAALAPLESLKSLRWLSVSGTDFAPTAIAELKKVRPGINIALDRSFSFVEGLNNIHRQRSPEVPEFKPQPDDAAEPEGPVARTDRQPRPAPATDSSGEKAFARLMKLGAVGFSEFDESGKRKIQVAWNDSWKGKDADLVLLADVETLGELSLDIDLKRVSPQAVSQIKLVNPLGTLFLEHATDEAFAEFTRLPACRGCCIDNSGISPASCRRLASLVPGVDSLRFMGGTFGHEEDGYTDEEMAELRRKAAIPGAHVWSGITDDGLAELTGLKNLEELELVYSPVTDVGLKHLVGMKRLKRLFLWDCPNLQAGDLAPLGSIDSLRVLTFLQPVSAAGLANIARLHKLEEFSADLSELKPADVAPLARLSSVNTLSLSGADRLDADSETSEMQLEMAPLGDAIAQAAGKMKSLRILSLKTPITNEGLAALAATGKLQAARLTLAEVNNHSLELVVRLPRLRQLRLDGPSKLSDRGFAPLGKLTQMIDLSLPGAGLTDACLAHLAPLTATQFLDLSGSQVTGTGLAALARWKSLQTLTLAHSAFDDEGCRWLPQFAALRSLDLFDTKITDAGLEQIAKLPELEKLFIYDTAVTDAGIAHLAPLKKLQQVTAMGTTVSDEGSRSLPGVWVIADDHPSQLEDDDGIFFPAEDASTDVAERVTPANEP